MGSLTKKLLVLRGLTDNRHTVLKFSEPAGTPRAVLFGSLLDGTYNKAFLIEEFEYLSMCFGLDGSTQSEMRIDAPYALVNEYTRKMMGFLAFQPRPERVLIVGLGGGSLVNTVTDIYPMRKSLPSRLIRTCSRCDPNSSFPRMMSA
jgi:hypothetical protein